MTVASTFRTRPLVLVADHHEEILLVLGVMLEAEGYEVVEAHTGADTLQLARETVPDVILLEVTLRDIDGYDVLQRLKSDPKTRDIPVIVITALSDEASRMLSLSIGADQHITKPWEGGHIEAAVANALAKRRSG